MSEKTTPAGRDRPFPWHCTKCQQIAVYPLNTDHSTIRKYDGRPYTIRLPALAIPTCRNCGERTFTAGVDDQIVAALRTQVGLLTPEEIQTRRGQLELSQQELAEQLGVAEETLAGWESGGLIPARAMDNLLRLFFESAEVRALLRRTPRPSPSNLPLLDRSGWRAAVVGRHGGAQEGTKTAVRSQDFRCLQDFGGYRWLAGLWPLAINRPGTNH